MKAKREKDCRPLREVVSGEGYRNALVGEYRVLILECGHFLIRQPAQKIPKRARCNDCEVKSL